MLIFNKSNLFTLLAVASFVATSNTANADPTALKPSALFELGVMGTHSLQHYGSFGPQNNLSDLDIKSVPQPVYLDKQFDQLKAGEQIQINKIEYVLHHTKNTTQELDSKSGSYTLDDIQQLAKAKVDSLSNKSGLLYDAAVTWAPDTQSLSIELTPLKLNSIDITAKDAWQERVLRHLLRVPTGKTLDFNHLKSQLRLIRNNPDLSFEPSFEVEPYSHSLKFKLDSSEHKVPVHVISSVSNLDQVAYGGGLYNVSAIANNVTGLGDSLMVSPSFGLRSQGVFSRYEVPVTARFRPFIDFAWAHIHPHQKLYDNFSYNNYSWRVTPGLKYVLMDKPNQRASVDLQLDFKESTTNSGSDTIEREAIRTLRAGINYDRQWDKTTFNFRNEIAAGLDIFGARRPFAANQPIANAGSQYLRTTGYAVVNRKMPLDSTLTVSTSWQYSPDSLPGYDTLCLGGAYTGRGYRELYLCGDSAAIGSVQWMAPASFLPKGMHLPFSKTDLREQLKVLTFVDAGYSNYNRPTFAADLDEWILSTGFGVRMQIANKLFGRFDLGFPLLRSTPFSSGARFHFGVDLIAF